MPESARILAGYLLGMAIAWYLIQQFRKPAGWLGRLIVRGMNRSHANLTSWGLGHVRIDRNHAILDIGCGGGRTVERLAGMADLGRVDGVDYSEASVDASRRLNRDLIESGRVAIHKATVSWLPFSDDRFDLVTAVETHYYWPDRPKDVREIFRVLKPGGTVLIIAEAYLGQRFGLVHQFGMRLIGGTLLSPDGHRDLLVEAGYADVQVFLETGRGWICVSARKPCV